jgi:norsolorinic acid ketoreductase
VLKLDSLSETDPKDVVAILPGYSISHIDVVIANAGVMKCNRITEISAAEYREHQNVNVIGPLLLFQATWKLLQKASNPKFVVISSTLGSVGIGPTKNVPSGSYGASKASVNYLMRKLHFEHPELIALPICPGYVMRHLLVLKFTTNHFAPQTNSDRYGHRCCEGFGSEGGIGEIRRQYQRRYCGGM